MPDYNSYLPFCCGGDSPDSLFPTSVQVYFSPIPICQPERRTFPSPKSLASCLTSFPPTQLTNPLILQSPSPRQIFPGNPSWTGTLDSCQLLENFLLSVTCDYISFSISHYNSLYVSYPGLIRVFEIRNCVFPTASRIMPAQKRHSEGTEMGASSMKHTPSAGCLVVLKTASGRSHRAKRQAALGPVLQTKPGAAPKLWDKEQA